MENTKKSSDQSIVHDALDAATVISIARHYHNAKTKHPYFADRVSLDECNVSHANKTLDIWRGQVDVEKERGRSCADTLVNCELHEVVEALARGDRSAAVEECYDVIAVMLRIIDVLEGRQALGRPKTAESGAE